MKMKTYITNKEYQKCQKVADVFSMLEKDDVILLDAGKYGFVALLYYTPPHGFENLKTFTDSLEMFDFLWEEWLTSQLIIMAKAMNLDDLDYDDVFDQLPEDTQIELMHQREIFLKEAGL